MADVLFPTQSTASLLEDEILQLEVEIEASKESLEAARRNETTSEEDLRCTKDAGALKKECTSIRPGAESSQKAYLMLRGLHSWNPETLDGDKMSFSSQGSSARTTTTLTFEVTSPSEVRTKAQLVSAVSAEIKKKAQKHHASISEYLATSVHTVVEKANRSEIAPISEISAQLQAYMWSLGRLEQTAAELQSLRRRYKGKLTRRTSEEYIFSVEFRSNSSCLAVDFEIDLSYPSLPMEVQLDLLEGDVDLDNLLKTLVKNAKPGFGNLSRACDIITAFVR